MAAEDGGVQFSSAREPRSTDFPAEWGFPPGSPYSEERAAWVLDHVRRHMGDPVRRLRKVHQIRLNNLRRELVARKAAEGEELDRLMRAKGLTED